MRIVSIQSFVAYGHAGNSAAVFPLQRLGHEVWPVHTVQFSNHTGYGSFRGTAFDPDEVAAVIAGIADRGMLGRADAVLTGYQGSPGVAQVVLDTVAQVKAANPAAVYCCDPVLGDVGKGMYVAPGIPELIRNRVVPAADILVPNAFELAYLAGDGDDPRTATPADVSTTPLLLAAVDTLRDRGPRTVLVTSIEDGMVVRPVPGGASGPGDTGDLFGLTAEGKGTSHDDGPDTADTASLSMIAVDDSGAWEVRTPKLPILVNGAGDVTTALFLAHLRTWGLRGALERTAASVFTILEATVARAADGTAPRAARGTGVEIALIPAQDAIVDPPLRFEAFRLR